MSLPNALLAHCENFFGRRITSVQALSGGDINEAYLLRLDQQQYFIKYNSVAFAEDMFSKEAKGLALLKEAKELFVPQCIDCGRAGAYGFLVLPYLATAPPQESFWRQLGKGLAHVHQLTAPNFGLAYDNYIGRLPQANRYKNNWPDFLVEERWQVQIRMAFKQTLLSQTELRQFDQLAAKLAQLLPLEKPSLLHGDLWRGNILVGAQQQAILIDPAIYYGHREMDLAMTQLFGGFAPSFYDSYNEHFPLAPGFSERVAIYQLYYLLVHLNLFGRSYLGQIKQILHRFV